MTDAYRDGWDRVFGKNNDPIAKIETSNKLKEIYAIDVETFEYSPCDACGEPEFHNIEAGVYSCEIES